MTTKNRQTAQNPLLLRCHRLMESFAKSDDERDFYLDRQEGFIIYVDLDKDQSELAALEKEIATNADRYCQIPKLTFYESKKIMEGFVNEKVYDIDTKEKLLDIIQSKEAREHFLEFIYDHHSELEKWQQYYSERWRIRIIEWLRKNNFQFVFEEDLDLSRKLLEKLKESLFEPKVGKDLLAARKILISKAKTYYSNEALNPRPKRGRPPKQAAKLEVEPQVSLDIYTTVPSTVRPFLFTPDISSASAVTFSSKFENKEDLLAHRKGLSASAEATLLSLNQKLATFRNLSNQLLGTDKTKKSMANIEKLAIEEDFIEEIDDINEIDEENIDIPKKLSMSMNNHKPSGTSLREGTTPKPVNLEEQTKKEQPKVLSKGLSSKSLKSEQDKAKPTRDKPASIQMKKKKLTPLRVKKPNLAPRTKPEVKKKK